MAPGPGVTWGRSGGIEISNEGDKTRRKIPLAIACTMAVVCNVITLFGYLHKWAGLAQVWWNEYEPYMWVGPLRTWFRRVDAVWTGTCEWIGPQFFLRLRPLFIEWMVCLGALVLFEQLPRILVADGLLPYGQYDPNAGLLTTWGMILAAIFHKDPPVEQDLTVDQPPIIINDGIKRSRTNTQIRHTEIPVPRAGREALARWFWRICRDGGVGFAQNVAQQYHIQRGECKKIQHVFVSRGWAVDRGGTQGFDLVGTADEPLDGLHKMWRIVSQFYPDAHPPQGCA